MMDQDEDVHQKRMKEAICLAQQSVVRTSPNPRVGCVIYDRNGLKLSEGVTSPPGGLHAESLALTLLSQAEGSAQGAHLYVTLEPCSHHGRTPPCVDQIIQAGVSHVYIGTIDPNPLVSGRGVQFLRDAGVHVTMAVCERECDMLHAPFKKWITTGRPWVSLKGAMTLDGCLATAQGHSKWITGPESRAHTHALRAQVDAIMVGGATARIDRPALTVRLSEGTDPIPILLSRALTLPKDLPCARVGAMCVHGPHASEDHLRDLNSRGLVTLEVPLNEKKKGLDLNKTLEVLGRQNITHLMVEGGGKLHGALLSEGLADDLHLYIAPKLIGRGRPLFNFPSVQRVFEGWELRDTRLQSLGQDLFWYGLLSRDDHS